MHGSLNIIIISTIDGRTRRNVSEGVKAHRRPPRPCAVNVLIRNESQLTEARAHKSPAHLLTSCARIPQSLLNINKIL